jgi:catechol 2,3-dioxygenase-like lactoylglutathione lyase family enzyme
MKYVVAFSGFSVSNTAKTLEFYNQTLGLEAKEDPMGIELTLPDNGHVFMYQKDDHQPATYTVLNLVVEDINTAVDELAAKGVVFERYDNMPGAQDERGILRGKAANMGPDIAWFKDPAGNILAALET